MTADRPLPDAQLLWGRAGLAAAARTQADWLWHGYLAKGAVTLLTSQWKSGKTTLISVLLARLQSGGELADRSVAPARAVVLSEEDPSQWARRAEHLDFANHVGWFCRPFRGRPRPADWLALLDRVADLAERERVGLAVIDPLAAFLAGHSENDAGAMLDTLLSLQRLTAAGVAVLVAHHPRKGDALPGRAARGSGALPAFADVLIEMHWHGRADHDDRRRHLIAFSRFPETPRNLVIELTADGTDYVSLGSVEDEEFTSHWQTLHAVLDAATSKLTRKQIRRAWPAEPPPGDATLYRWLERAIAQNAVRKDGKGLRNHPFRYWLPAKEPEWLQNPLAFFRMPELFSATDQPGEKQQDDSRSRQHIGDQIASMTGEEQFD